MGIKMVEEDYATDMNKVNELGTFKNNLITLISSLVIRRTKQMVTGIVEMREVGDVRGKMSCGLAAA